ncbi:MAG: DNA cytosine methyltransferase, partial [archaeon]|nr:DNA cytosine methyltransferase [archaeon]
PCQGFSFAGKRDVKDNRNQMYKEYLRFVRIIEPKVAVMENVQGLLSMRDFDGEKVIDKILHEFIAMGYSVCYKVLKASDYKVPQNRKRLIIIAKKLDLFPEPSGEKRTVIDAISSLEFYEEEINGHVFFKTKEETKQRYHKLKQGEKLSKTFNCSPERLHADKPSKTIVTKQRFIHPYYDRLLTPRELARLQSFPDDFYFCGSKTSMVKQIGNAVPPLLARAVAEKILEGLI